MTSLKEEHEWLVEHHKEAEKYSGRWIAILDGKIVSYGKSFGAARRKATRKSDGAPLVLYIPKKSEELLIL